VNRIIILYTSDLYRGGVAFSVSRLSRLLVNRGWHAEVLTYEDLPVRYQAGTLSGVATLNCPYSRTSHKGALKQLQVRIFRYPFVFVAAFRFSRFLNKVQAAGYGRDEITVIAFTHAPIVSASLVKRFGRKPFRLIASERQDPSRDLKNRYLRAILKWGYSVADLVHVNSPALTPILTEVFDLPEARMALVPNVIDPASPEVLDSSLAILQTGLDAKEIRAVAVGRLAPQKAVYLAPLILAELKKAGYSVSLDIVGDGDEAIVRDIKTIAAHAGMTDEIHFLGERKEFRSELGRYNLGMFLTNWESFGNVLGEYLAAGVVTLASDTKAGLVNYLEDGKHCLKIPVVHYEDALESTEPERAAKRIAEVFADPGLALFLRTNAISAAEAFSPSEHVAQFEKVVE